MRVKPAREGLLIPFPGVRQYVPDEGCEVPRARYWLRWINRGDLVVVEDEGEGSKSAKSSKVHTITKGRATGASQA